MVNCPVLKMASCCEYLSWFTHFKLQAFTHWQHDRETPHWHHLPSEIPRWCYQPFKWFWCTNHVPNMDELCVCVCVKRTATVNSTSHCKIVRIGTCSVVNSCKPKRVQRLSVLQCPTIYSMISNHHPVFDSSKIGGDTLPYWSVHSEWSGLAVLVVTFPAFSCTVHTSSIINE